MVEIGDPFAKTDIVQALKTVNQTLSDYFGGLFPEQFFTHPPGVWSAAENLDHLVLAVGALLRGMRLPHFLIRARFGKPAKPSRHYAEIRATYRETLANGGKAGGGVLPKVEDAPTDPKAIQTELLDKWAKISNDLVSSSESWSEADLESHQLPHPLLGLMTVRELLLWTMYHNLHHMDDTQHLFESTG